MTSQNYVFTSESVSEGHPDKVCDRISDAILDAFLTEEPNARVACETLFKTGMVLIAGEITTTAKPDYEHVIRETIREIGYTSSQERIIFDNYHLTFWHKDRQVAASVPSGWGVNFSASRYLNDKMMPFLRGGYADDGGSLLQKSLSVGMGRQVEAFEAGNFVVHPAGDQAHVAHLGEQVHAEPLLLAVVVREVLLHGFPVTRACRTAASSH